MHITETKAMRASGVSWRRLGGVGGVLGEWRPGMAAAALVLVAWGGHAALAPTDLKCEYLRNPLGIDVTRPRLSWRLETTEPDRRGQRQTAYQVLVASSLEKLRAGEGDLWDSGRVASAETVHVVYGGAPLTSEQVCYWKVRVWDQDGRASDWSAPARWSMGLLRPEDWKGVWIGRDEEEPDQAVVKGNWMWADEGNPAEAAPVGTRYFRRAFDLLGGRRVRSARWWVTADNRFRAFVNGEIVGEGANFKRVWALDVTRRLRPGRNVLAIEATNDGETPNPAAVFSRLEVEFEDGKSLVLESDGQWRTSGEPALRWKEPAFDDAAWRPAKVLGAVGMAPWGEVRRASDRRLPARYLRKEFAVSKPVRRAMVYYSGLGLSELSVNGQRVGDEVLSPGLTEYTKRVFYVTHDVTRLLQQGANAVGVVLGNGRFYAPRLTEPTATRTYGYPKLLFQMRIEYTDGSSELVVSDTSWQLTTDGPIRENNEYDGEVQDGRLAMPGWDRAGFRDPLGGGASPEGLERRWEPAQEVAPPGGRLVAPMMEPIRVTERLRPVAVTERSPGVFIVDMGQNMVGWCRLRVRGPRGTVITLRHAERLQEDGSLYVANLRGAKATDTFILRGEGLEVFEPRFTYHGFRYVEVRGYPGRLGPEAIEGCVVHDDLEPAGRWVCSEPIVNRIYRNVVWGVRGNYRSIPTDCPQRDERQGWLGDRSEESRGETYLFDTAALYAKWLRDMEDAQKDNGSVPDVCPAYWPIYSDNVTWPGSTVIIPGHLYEQYGDVRVLEGHYGSMKRWMDYMAGFMKDGLLARDQYGDWCVPPEEPQLIHSRDPARRTSKEVLASSYYYHCCRLMARYARVLGREDDAAAFDRRAEVIREAFNRRLYRPDKGWYDNGSQTACVLPLAFGLTPEAERGRVFARLIDKIAHESHGHVGTGLVGGQWLMRTLTAGGRVDVAWQLATNRTYPSWGYMVEQGATTIWELWNGDTADPAMNSGNHVMLVGDLITWLYEHLAGIRTAPETPAFGRLWMAPETPAGLEYVQASYRSIRGEIQSYWRRQGDRFLWQVRVPPNVTARVGVPAAPDAAVKEGRGLAADQPGVRYLGWRDGRAWFDVDSGSYRFESRLP
ncbi:MAG: alpha-rhamnosidase [Verrucomicrobia bacterium]|nr:MAG: alpha-rhamnosidase [Verrucomicrobiota bacterium]